MSSDILTQEELDALLEMVKGGARSAPAVAAAAASAAPAREAVAFRPGRAVRSFERPDADSWDFRGRSLLSERELARLEAAMNQAARGVANAVGAMARTSANVSPSDPTNLSARILLESLPRPCLLFLIDLGLDDAKGALILDPAQLVVAVDLMLGGTGNVPPLLREPTRAELAVGRRLADLVLGPVRDALQELMPVTLRILRLETDARVVDVFTPNDALMVYELQLDAGPLGGPVRLALPARAMAAAMQKAVPPPPAPTPRGIGAGSPVRQLPVDAVAVLGETEVPLRALLELEVGDVLRLDRRLREPIEVKVPGERSLRARPGTKAGRIALKLEQGYGRGGES